MKPLADIETYATGLDSNVNNILNALNTNQGQIKDPYPSGF